MPHLERSGAQIWWESTGHGPPVLMIQGLGYPSDAWWRLLPGLQEHFCTIVVDNRGTGRSSTPEQPWTVEDMADDAAAAIRAAGAPAAHVIGASMGGLIAQELALLHPELVQSLVLGCTSPGGSDAVPMDGAALQMLSAPGARTPREAAENAIPFVYADDTPRHLIAEDIEVRMRRPTGAAGYLGQLRAVGQYRGSAARLHTLAVPVLVVHGTADRLVPPANAEVLTRLIPGARLAMLDGAGHIFVSDRTAETLRLLTQFLDEATGVIGC